MMTQNDTVLGRILLEKAEAVFSQHPMGTALSFPVLFAYMQRELKLIPHDYSETEKLVQKFFVNNPRFERVKGVGGGIRLLPPSESPSV